MKQKSNRFDEVLAELSKGKTLTSICKRDGYPTRHAVMKRVSENPEYQARYKEALENRLEVLADQLTEIADTDIKYMDAAAVNLLRLKSDNIKWVLERLRASKYGNRVNVDHGGQEGNPIVHVIERRIVDPLLNPQSTYDNDEPTIDVEHTTD